MLARSTAAPAAKGVLRRLAVVLVVTLGVFACGDAESRQQEYLSRAKELFEAGDYARAGVEFRNVLQIEPKHVESIYYLGLIAEEQEDFETAFKHFRVVSQLDETHVQARLRIAQYLLLGGQIEQSRSTYEELLTLAPDDLEVQTVGAAIALREEDLDTAESKARSVLEADPAAEGAMSVLAGAMTARGQLDEAIDLTRQTLEKVPDSDTLQQLLLRLLIQAGRNDEAVAAYRDVIAANPEEFPLRAQFARFLLTLDRQDEAVQVLREAIADQVGGTEARLSLSGLLRATQGVEAAVAELRAGIEAEPETHAYRFAMAELQFQADQPDEARADLDEIIDRAGTDEDGLNARTALARLELSLERRAAAETLIEEVLEVDPENAGARFLQGTLNLADGKIEDAVSDLRVVLRGNPDNVEALRLLAQAQLAQGDVSLATRTLDQLVRLAPRDAGALGQLASLQARQGDPGKALETLDRALGVAPKSASLLEAKASLSAAEGRWESAEDAITALGQLPDQGDTGRLLLARLRHQQGRYEDAFEGFEAFRADNPDAMVAVAGAVRALMADGQAERALEYIDGLRAENAENAFLTNLKGEVLAREEQWQDAADSFAEAIQLQPDAVPSYIGLADSQQRLGNPDDAVAALEQGLEAVSDNPTLLMELGSLLASLERNEDALDIFRALSTQQPENALAVNNYASLLAALEPDNLEELREAKALLDPFLRTSNPFVLDTIGALLLRLGDARQAQAYLERALALEPSLPDAHFHLGLALLELDAPAVAAEHLEQALNAEGGFLGKEEAEAALRRARESMPAEN
jgi:tetratricopeptide (TPR) repeat protein